MSDKIISSDTKRKNRLPPGQFESKSIKWPTLNIEKPPEFEKSSWRLIITGLVKEEKKLSYDELIALGISEVFADFHCVTSFSILNNTWKGILTEKLKTIVEILPEAGAVMCYAHSNYTTNMLIDDFFGKDVLLAFSLNGKDLTPLQGFPLRLVVPKLYAYKSIKWIQKIEFLKENTPGYWEERGYHLRADPWKEERYSK